MELTRREVLLGLACCPLSLVLSVGVCPKIDRPQLTQSEERGSFGPLGSALDCDVAWSMAMAIAKDC